MKIWNVLLCLLPTLCLNGFTSHIEELQHVPSPIQKYHLVDIGETDIPTDRLSRLRRGLTYAPSINNKSQVAWNSSAGGSLKSLKKPINEFIPRFEGMRLYFIDVNDEGDLLISIERGHDSIEWLLWPYDGANYNHRQHIHTADPFAANLVLSGFNKDRRVVGHFKKDGSVEPAAWSHLAGLHPLGKSAGLEALGIARNINDRNTVVGLYEEMKVSSPFIWSHHTGFEVMRNYRDKLFPIGWMEFSDILITPDDVVYGNYWLKHGSFDDSPKVSTPHYGYIWKPRSSEIEQLDLEGMRLTSVNQGHTLVGSWQGRAAIREINRRPLFIDLLMSPSELEGWDLLEATGINDEGQIIGYGTFKGKTHIFLAEPTEL